MEKLHLIPTEICFIGDNPFTDIIMANLLKCPSILTHKLKSNKLLNIFERFTYELLLRNKTNIEKFPHLKEMQKNIIFE